VNSVGGPFGILVEYVCTLSHYNPIRIWLYIQVESDEIENYMCSCSQSVDKFKTWIGLSTQTMYFSSSISCECYHQVYYSPMHHFVRRIRHHENFQRTMIYVEQNHIHVNQQRH
ncbi:hypothetical protein KC19_12G144300, partial [Ceratodon purpureus]